MPAHCAPLAGTEKGLAVASPGLPGAVQCLCLLPRWRTGQPSCRRELAALRIWRGSCHAHDHIRLFIFSVAEGAMAWAVTSVAAHAQGVPEGRNNRSWLWCCWGWWRSRGRSSLYCAHQMLSGLWRDQSEWELVTHPPFTAFAAMGKRGPSDLVRITAWTVMASETSEGACRLTPEYFSFWSETTEVWSFSVPGMVDVPKGVCRRLLILTYFL